MTTTNAPAPRVVRRRRPVVGRRSAIGGVLVAAAMVLTFAAYSSADPEPPDQVLVATRAIRAGDVIEHDAIAIERSELPDVARGQVFRDPAELAGAVALTPLAAGDLVQRSAVLVSPPGDDSGEARRELSLPIDRDRALNGDIVPGESVDVLATYGTGEAAYTLTVTRRARVVDVAETSGGLGSDGRVVVVLALDAADAVLRATHASVAAVVTLVRSTRTPDDDGPDRFAPSDTLDR